MKKKKKDFAETVLSVISKKFENEKFADLTAMLFPTFNNNLFDLHEEIPSVLRNKLPSLRILGEAEFEDGVIIVIEAFFKKAHPSFEILAMEWLLTRIPFKEKSSIFCAYVYDDGETWKISYLHRSIRSLHEASFLDDNPIHGLLRTSLLCGCSNTNQDGFFTDGILKYLKLKSTDRRIKDFTKLFSRGRLEKFFLRTIKKYFHEFFLLTNNESQFEDVVRFILLFLFKKMLGGYFVELLKDEFSSFLIPDKEKILNERFCNASCFPKFLIELNKFSFSKKEPTASDFDLSIGPDILGTVYETLLGFKKNSSLQHGRRKSGTYYTPVEIADYMALQALVHFLDRTKIKRKKIDRLLSSRWEKVNLPLCVRDGLKENLKNLRVLDPACGSGAFIMAIIKRLFVLIHKIDDRYDSHIINSIIANNITGIDTDSLSIDILKLRIFIYLKDLCVDFCRISNSEILTFRDDFLDSKDEMINKLKSPRYDIVIGNPPYLSLDPKFRNVPAEKLESYKKKYCSFGGLADIFVLFVEEGYEVLDEQGVLLFITKNNWQKSESFRNFCSYLFDKRVRVIDFSDFPVFKGVGVTSNIIFIQKVGKPVYEHFLYDADSKSNIFSMSSYFTVNDTVTSNLKIECGNSSIIKKIEFTANSGLIGGTGHKLTPSVIFILKKTGDKEYEFDDRFLLSKLGRFTLNFSDQGSIRPFTSSGYIHPFFYLSSDRYLFYPREFDWTNRSVLTEIIGKAASLIGLDTEKPDFHNGKGYRNVDLIERKNKIIFPYMTYNDRGPSFCIDESSVVIGMDSVAIVPEDDSLDHRYVTAILNSRLYWYFYKESFKKYKNRQTIDIKKVRVPMLHQAEQLIFIEVVDKIHDEISRARFVRKWGSRYETPILSELRREIDRSVYSLFEISDREIKLIESDINWGTGAK